MSLIEVLLSCINIISYAFTITYFIDRLKKRIEPTQVNIVAVIVISLLVVLFSLLATYNYDYLSVMILAILALILTVLSLSYMSKLIFDEYKGSIKRLFGSILSFLWACFFITTWSLLI